MTRKQAANWYVLTLLGAVNFLHYANRNVVVTMYDDLRDAFDSSSSELGLLTTVFMLVHAPATVFFGWLSDRMDRRKILAGGVLVWSIASLLSVFAEGIGSLLAARALIGLGTAACVPVANALICDAFPNEMKARAVSVFNLGLFFGGACGTVLGEKLGFPVAFIAIGAPGVGIAFLVATMKLGATSESSSSDKTSNDEPARATLVVLAKSRTFRWTVLGAVLMAFSAGAYLAWFFDFLEKVKGASEDQALTILGVSMITGLLGVLTGGAVADRLHRRYSYGRQAAIAIGIGASVPMALIVIYLPLGIPFYLGSWALMFFISWYHGPLAASVDDMVSSKRAGFAQGIYIAIMHLCGTAPASWLVGKVADSAGLQMALLIPTATMALAALCFVASFRTLSQQPS